MRTLVWLMTFCVAVAAASRVQAWVPNGAQWDPAILPVSYRVNAASVPSTLDPTMAVAAVDAGFAAWAAPSCTSFEARNAGGTTRARGNSSDRENSVLWISGSWPAELGDVSSTIGITTSSRIVGGYTIDADIQFNNVGFTWSLDGRRDTVDTQSIATHEEGHFLGLGHPPDMSAVMYFQYGGGLKRTLAADDVTGVCSLYPSGAALPDAGTTPDAGSAADPCAGFSRCGTCTGADGCGWCNSISSCFSGTSGGASGGRCPAAGGWAWLPSDCPGTAMFGEPCGGTVRCAAGGRCITDGTGGGAAFCSHTCATDCDCEMGYACGRLPDGTGVCAHGTNRCPPPDAGYDAGPPRDAGSDAGHDAAVARTDAGGLVVVSDAGGQTPDATVARLDGGVTPRADGGGSAGFDGGAARDGGRNGGSGGPPDRGGCACRVEAAAAGSEAVRGAMGVFVAALGLLVRITRRQRRAQS